MTIIIYQKFKDTNHKIQRCMNAHYFWFIKKNTSFEFMDERKKRTLVFFFYFTTIKIRSSFIVHHWFFEYWLVETANTSSWDDTRWNDIDFRSRNWCRFMTVDVGVSFFLIWKYLYLIFLLMKNRICTIS